MPLSRRGDKILPTDTLQCAFPVDTFRIGLSTTSQGGSVFSHTSAREGTYRPLIWINLLTMLVSLSALHGFDEECNFSFFEWLSRRSPDRCGFPIPHRSNNATVRCVTGADMLRLGNILTFAFSLSMQQQQRVTSNNNLHSRCASMQPMRWSNARKRSCNRKLNSSRWTEVRTVVLKAIVSQTDSNFKFFFPSLSVLLNFLKR